MASDNDFCRVWVGNLSDKVGEELLYELFLQAGPVDDVTMPKDSNGRSSSYGFVTFKHQCSVSYAVDLLDRTSLFGRELKIRPKQKQMPQQSNDIHCTMSLRGYGGDLGMKGREDLQDPFSFKSSGLTPSKENPSVANNQEIFGNIPDFNLLLQMGQMLQSPYASLTGGPLGCFPPPMYPSQMMNPISSSIQSSKHSDDSNRRSQHNRQNDYRSRSRHERDSNKPYSRDRYDDRRGHHSSSRYHQSSSSHHRERR